MVGPSKAEETSVGEMGSCRLSMPDDAAQTEFAERGFILREGLLPAKVIDTLREKLEAVCMGRYSTGRPPFKKPKIPHISRGLYNQLEPKTIQIINIFHADVDFRDVVTCPRLGEFVARVAGWSDGARVAQDQVWVKPPGASELVFHRDSTYFDFDPADVVTVWLALDDMDVEVGPLEYAVGSHTWGDARRGSAHQFFTSNRRELLDDAATRQGIDPNAVEIVTAGVRAGGAGIHNGRTWHGSGPNMSSTLPRRGLGIHFVPATARFSAKPMGMWRRLQEQNGGGSELPNEDCPITWQPPPSVHPIAP